MRGIMKKLRRGHKHKWVLLSKVRDGMRAYYKEDCKCGAIRERDFPPVLR